MGNPDGFAEVRRIARQREKAQRRVDELIEAENAAMLAVVDEQGAPRGIYARLREVTGWSDEYVRKAVEKARHDATPSVD